MTMQTEKEVDRIFRKVMNLDSGEDIDKIEKDQLARWDSLRQAELMIILQNTFSIRFRVEEILKIDSVRALRELVIKLVNEKTRNRPEST